MTTDLSSIFREIRAELAPWRERIDAAHSALDLLERDLLPRSAGGDPYVVVGIVGPNNAGKSALFNALIGRNFSPSMPTGGATRRLVGALHPELLSKLQSEPTLSRFRLREVNSPRADMATERTEDPAEVLISTDESLPRHVMLIDTPDFDSILDDNRLASESLLAVADLVIGVVTRHSYQNRAVVDFLESWFAHGRPWVLVYNEAIDHQTAASHADKLAADVGTPPLARFWAPHDLEVQSGSKVLAPKDLTDEARTLQSVLFDLDAVTEVKARAFDAARARLQTSIRQTAVTITSNADNAAEILHFAEEAAHRAGLRIASAAMPGGPFVEAFRDVLDRRTNFLSRGWRKSLRQLRLGIESLPSLLSGTSAAEEEDLKIDGIERDALDAVWPGYWEEFVRDLGPEARHAARERATKEVAELLDRDLSSANAPAQARQRAHDALKDGPGEEIGTFRRECERLVEVALEKRGFDIDIQAAADILTLVPIALAAAVIVNTGGIGSDVAAAGGGALSTFLVEKYCHLLGSSVMSDAQRRWTELRGERLGRILLAASLPQAAGSLESTAAGDARAAEKLVQLADRLSSLR